MEYFGTKLNGGGGQALDELNATIKSGIYTNL